MPCGGAPYSFRTRRNFKIPTRVISIQHSPNNVQRFLATKVDSDPDPGTTNNTLESEAMTNIPGGFPEMQ